MNRKSGYGSSLPTWHVTQHVQTQSPPKPGPFPRFSSSMKGIIVSVWVLLQKMPSGSEKVLATLMGSPRAQITCQRSLTLGRNGLALIPLLCSFIGWEQPESAGPSVNRAAELKVQQWRLAVFFVEDRSEYLRGCHNHSFSCGAWESCLLSPSPLSLRPNPSPRFWPLYLLNISFICPFLFISSTTTTIILFPTGDYVSIHLLHSRQSSLFKTQVR